MNSLSLVLSIQCACMFLHTMHNAGKLETTMTHIGDDCVMILRLLTAHTPEFSALMETNYGKQRFLTFSCHHSSACTKVVSWLERWLSG